MGINRDELDQAAAERRAHETGEELEFEETRPLAERLQDAIEREAESLEAEEEEVPALTQEIAAAVADHHARLIGLLGEHVNVQACPYCLGMGIQSVELRQDPSAHTCETCGGFGSVLTGSRVDSRTARTCPVCQGNGYTVDATMPAPQGVAPDIASPARILRPDELPAPPAEMLGAVGA